MNSRLITSSVKLNNEIQRLRKAIFFIDDQLMEYRDVMDIKIQLDSEIAADRSLLECENRPSISMVESAMWYGRVSTQTQARRIRLETDSGARSLVQESRSASDFSVLTMSKDALEVTDVNAKTKFIKVFNTSSY